MKSIIVFCCTILSSASLFSMESAKLIIENKTNKTLMVDYKQSLTHHVHCKRQIISAQQKFTTISLPMTNALRINVDGYNSKKIFVPEYVTLIVVKPHEDRSKNCMVISQGYETLAILKPIKEKQK